MKGRIQVTLTLLTAVFVLASCDNFFSKSWGKERAYKTDSIEINAGNWEYWLDQATGNPALADALTQKILSELGRTDLSAADRALLQNAGVKLSIEASGLGSVIITNATGAIASINDSDVDGVKNLIKGVQNDFGASGVVAASNLAKIVNGSVNKSGGQPRFNAGDEYAKNASPADVGQAVAVLTLAVVDGVDVDTVALDDLSRFGLVLDEESQEITVDSTAGDNVVALAAYLNLIADDTSGKFESNQITSEIKKAFLKSN